MASSFGWSDDPPNVLNITGCSRIDLSFLNDMDGPSKDLSVKSGVRFPIGHMTTCTQTHTHQMIVTSVTLYGGSNFGYNLTVTLSQINEMLKDV